jgi:tRNA threonylcarbamoyladenosine biosynthesis protein TsaB
MRILALETSSTAGSVAALEGEQLCAEQAFPSGQRTAQSFAPTMQALLAQVGWRPRDVQLIAVTRGPGSFTGLRVGVTAAKTLAYAVGAQVIGVDTLRVIACQVPSGVGAGQAVLDAQRGQLFAARFQRTGLPPAEECQVERGSLVDIDAWLAALAPGDCVAGPGLDRVRGRVPAGVVLLPPESGLPRAATVGRVGYLAYRAGSRDDLWSLQPDYYRKSAAEEKRDGASHPGS